MKVGDIRKLIKDGEDEIIILSLIKRVKVPYKEFTVNTTQIVTIQNILNERPRKSLKFLTPNEVFFKEFLRKKVA